MKLNILIVGVGGQGALTTAAIIARAAMRAGLNVITAETHGMAQRGGSVEVHVRLGDVKAPLIPDGGADVAVVLEPSEILRYAKYLNEKTLVILNDRQVIPPLVSAGLGKYPSLEEVVESIRGITQNVMVVSASKIAEELGNVQAANVVVIGMLLAYAKMPFSYEQVEDALKEVLPEKLWDINLKALNIGFKSVQPSGE